MATSDFELLDAWRDGDTTAGNELFERYFDQVSRFFVNKVSAEVEDLVQDVFLKCLHNRDTFRKQASFRTYIFQIARNHLYDYYRKRARRAVDFTSESVADQGTSPSGVVGRNQEHQLLLIALRSISIDHQIALELYYWEDMTGPELAGVLEISPHTVRSRLHRARKALEDALRSSRAPAAIVDATITNLDDWASQVRYTVESGG